VLLTVSQVGSEANDGLNLLTAKFSEVTYDGKLSITTYVVLL